MPEQQASPSSRPPSSAANDQKSQYHYDTTPPSTEFSKRTYLSLLPPPQLIDLILAIDANRQTLIFPHDLDSAIKALQRPQRHSSSPSPKEQAMSIVVKVELDSSSASPLPPRQSLSPPFPPPPVQPPQYKAPYRPPHPHHLYPNTHTPYYPPPHPPPPQAPLHVSSPAPPARHPLFTSTPLTRDPNKPLAARPTPPPAVSSRDDPNAMPSYEEMIVEAIVDVGDGDGTAPKILFSWMASHYPLQQNFRPSASQALHKALKRGRLEKIGGKYRLNPSWGGGPTTSKRATRRPTANRAITPPASRPHPPPIGVLPPGYAHTQHPYGYVPYPHHPSFLSNPSLPPNAYSPAYGPNGFAWVGQTQPVPQLVDSVDVPAKLEEMEEYDGVESEDGELRKQVEESVDGKKKEQMRQSLVRLARVLRRFAQKGEGKGEAVQE